MLSYIILKNLNYNDQGLEREYSGRALALPSADLGSIPGAPYGPSSLHRSNPLVQSEELTLNTAEGGPKIYKQIIIIRKEITLNEKSKWLKYC